MLLKASHELPWPNAPWFQISHYKSGFTLAIWVKFHAFPIEANNWHSIISSKHWDNQEMFRLTTVVDHDILKTRFECNRAVSDTWHYLDTEMPLELNIWTHLIMTFKFPHIGPGCSAYKNGIVVSQPVCGTFSEKYQPLSANQIVVGRAGVNSGYSYSHVTIDDVMLFDELLDGTQAKRLYSLWENAVSVIETINTTDVPINQTLFGIDIPTNQTKNGTGLP